MTGAGRPSQSSPGFPIGFAHRGGRGGERPNSLAAFAVALDLGANGLESDVWLTADGVPVLDHDGRVGRWFSLRRRSLRRLRHAELPAHLPSLAELYQRCGIDFALSLDIRDPAVAPAVVAVARRYGATERLWLVGHRPPVADWAALDPQLHVVAGAAGLDLHRLRAAGGAALNLPYRLWNSSRVAAVHAAGLRAFGWEAHEPARIQALLDLGCDAVYSDDVAALVHAVRAA